MSIANKILFLIEFKDKITKTVNKVQASFKELNFATDSFNAHLRQTTYYKKSLSYLPYTISRIKERINELNSKIDNTFDINQIRLYRVQLNHLEKELSRIKSKSKPLGQKIREGNNLTSSLLGLAGGGFLAKDIIRTTSEFEKMRAVLNNTLGSGAGQSAWQMIQQFAQQTPYQLEEVFNSYIKLVNRGMKPTEEQMRSLGDLAASMGKSYDQLVEAILDAQTFEFERLKEFGIKAQKQGNKIAFTFKGQTTVINATSDAITNYLLSLGKTNGVLGAMSAMSKTLGGRLSNLQDNFTKLKYKIGQMFLPLMTTTVNILNKIMVSLEKHPNLLKALTSGFLALASALAIYIPLQWLLNIAMSANPIGGIIVGISILIGVMTYIIIKIEYFINLWKRIRLQFTAVLGVMSFVFKRMFFWISLIIEGVLQLFKLINYLFKYGLKQGFKLWAQEFINEYIIKPLNQLILLINKIFHTKWKPVKLINWVNKEELDKQRAAQKKTSGLTNTISKLTGGGGGLLPGGGGASPLGSTTSSGIEAITSGGKKNINITVKSLVENLTVMAQDIKEGAEEIREIIAQEMLKIVNSANEVA